MTFPLQFNHDEPMLYWIDDSDGVWLPQPVSLVDRDGVVKFDYAAGDGYKAATVALKQSASNGLWKGRSTSGGTFQAVRAELGDRFVVTGAYHSENEAQGCFVLVYRRRDQTLPPHDL